MTAYVLLPEEKKMDESLKIQAEAAAFRRLVKLLREKPDVQNIELMNLAGFCRNCLSKWYRAEMESLGQHSQMQRRVKRSMGCPTISGKRAIKGRQSRAVGGIQR